MNIKHRNESNYRAQNYFNDNVFLYKLTLFNLSFKKSNGKRNLNFSHTKYACVGFT